MDATGSSNSGWRPPRLFLADDAAADDDEEPGEAADETGPVFAALAAGAASPESGKARFILQRSVHSSTSSLVF